uniref:SSD domain-containing protein n=1 Tax=Anopheles maculatus TaxID=74869 RepID=A0A182SKY1_9DIPT
GFITSIGNRDRRVKLALEHCFAPIVHGVITSALAIFMLSTSSFEFVVRHFFWLLLSAIVIGALNGLFFFPILLSMIGPGAEVIPLQYANRISTPSPPPKRINKLSSGKPIVLNNKRSSCSRSCSKPHHHHKHNNVNLSNEPSLTTITEEPQSWKSSASSIASMHEKTTGGSVGHHRQSAGLVGGGGGGAAAGIGGGLPSSTSLGGSMMGDGNLGGVYSHPHAHHYHHHHHQQAPELQSIVLQPEVTVETHHHGGEHQNTKVTATANIKVELVTPGRATRMMHTTASSTSSNASSTGSTSSSTGSSGSASS